MKSPKSKDYTKSKTTKIDEIYSKNSQAVSMVFN